MKTPLLLAAIILTVSFVEKEADASTEKTVLTPEIKQILESKHFVKLSGITAEDIGFSESGTWDRSTWDRIFYKYKSESLTLFLQVTVDPSDGEVFIDSIYKDIAEDKEAELAQLNKETRDMIWKINRLTSED